MILYDIVALCNVTRCFQRKQQFCSSEKGDALLKKKSHGLYHRSPSTHVVGSWCPHLRPANCNAGNVLLGWDLWVKYHKSVYIILLKKSREATKNCSSFFFLLNMWSCNFRAKLSLKLKHWLVSIPGLVGVFLLHISKAYRDVHLPKSMSQLGTTFLHVCQTEIKHPSKPPKHIAVKKENDHHATSLFEITSESVIRNNTPLATSIVKEQ